ncbi:MAG: hypothetical protein ACLF0P_09735 [Thermoanaerobaculia bacterium]
MRELDEGVWLKVAKARLEKNRLEVQVEGDRADGWPRWWPVAENALGDDERETFRVLVECLDKKRTVLAKLQPIQPDASDFGGVPKAEETFLGCRFFRIQHGESRLT